MGGERMRAEGEEKGGGRARKLQGISPEFTLECRRRSDAKVSSISTLYTPGNGLSKLGFS